MHVLDITILFLYLFTCLIIGLLRSVRIKTVKQFALGYKDISSTALICTVFSSVTGAGTTLGAAEKAYLFGIIFVIRQLFAPIGWLITSFIITPGIEKFKGCLSISEIMYCLYGPAGRYITSLAALVLSLGAMTVQGAAMGYLFHYFFGIVPFYGMLIGYGILTTYSMLGGIKAVIVTEIFKFFVFFTVVPISYLFASTKVGGFTNLINVLPENYTLLSITKENIILLLTLTFYFIFPRYEAPFIQRCLIAQNAKQLKSCLKNIALLSLPFSISFCAIAYIVAGNAPEVNSKEIVFYYIEYYLPIGLQGIMVAGLFATMMSLAESQLSATSIILVNDIIKQILPQLNDSKQLLLLKITILSLSIASVTLVTTKHDLMNIAWLAYNFYDPIISIPLTAGFLGFKTNQVSFITNTIFAILFTFIGRIYTGEFAITSFCFGIAGSAIGFFGAHYFQKIFGLNNLINEIDKNIHTPIQIRIHIWIKGIIKQLRKKPQNLKYKEFGIFTLSAYFIYSLYLCFISYYDRLLYLVIIGYFLCLILLSREITFSIKIFKRHLNLYWNFVLIYCLPFVSTYMLLFSQGDDFWVINGIFTAISLYFFVDAIKYLVFYSIGTLSAFITFLLTDNSTHTLANTLASVIYIIIFILLTSVLFLRSREREQEEKVETMHIFGGAIAHEVKSPLATLSMGAQQLSYLLNKTADSIKSGKISETTLENFKLLTELTQVIDNVSKQSIKTVDGLLTSLKSTVIADDKGIYEISQVINLTINEYASIHNLEERLEVNIIHNFKFFGSLHYIKHVLFNLISNAIKYGGHNIYITITTKNNSLYFRDSGKGIAKRDLPYIFDKFYTQGRTGTGIGLSFCKMVMEDIGGEITCRSIVGNYTEFELFFPKVPEINKSN